MGRFIKKFIFMAILLILASPIKVIADGVIFPPPGYWMQETDQKAVIFFENNIETMILSVSFRGDAKDFSWIVPTPSRPEISKSTYEIFTALEELTRPEYDYRIMPMYGGVSEFESSDKEVEIIEIKKVDYYEIAVLEAKNSDSLAEWLVENNYQFPAEAKYLLDDYIKNEWYFTAIKIDASAIAPGVEKQLAEGRAVPIKFIFSSPRIVYPLKISAAAQYLKGNDLRFFPEPEPMDNRWDSEEGNNISDNCASHADCGGLFCPQVIGQDTSCCISGQCVCGPSDCRLSGLRSESEIYPIMPSKHYWQPGVPVMLYIFSDKKKELPGFNIDYANWVKREKIEKLGVDPGGEPWIKPKAGKNFLTKMSRYMQLSEMTYDLYPRDASDNSKIGVARPNWHGTIIGILIFLVVLSMIFVLGFITPPGLIFAVCALIQFFSKSKAARAVAWFFQSLSLLITLSIGIIWFIGWYHYGEISWYGMMPYNWTVIYTKSIFAAGISAWFIFVGLMTGIMVWQILRQRKK